MGAATVIDYLEQLVETGEYAKAIELGEQLLKDRENQPVQVLAIHCALLQSRCALGQLEGAVATGKLCLTQAKELHQWDYFGKVSLYLGVAHARLHRHREAVDLYAQYIDHINLYKDALRLQLMAWYNLGLSNLAVGDWRSAALSLTAALDKASTEGNTRTLHGVRQALVQARIAIGEFSSVPKLLAQCAHYLRYAAVPSSRTSRLYHLELRARFAAATGRASRARLLCLRGLEEAGDDFEHLAFFHMLLARLAWGAGAGCEALGHSTAAQIAAKHALRPDLETESAELTYSLSRTFSYAAEDVDAFYLW